MKPHISNMPSDSNTTIESPASEAQSVAPESSLFQAITAALAIIGIVASLCLHSAGSIQLPLLSGQSPISDIPLEVVLLLGGTPLVLTLLKKLCSGQFGSDLLAGISIVVSTALHEYLAGALVVLMLSGGEALEVYASRSASSVLRALSRRMPHTAVRKHGERLEETPLESVVVGDILVVLPHALCPVDGSVVDGHGFMDESYLTGEPYQIAKAPGTPVLSGAVNGDAALTIVCERPASDSRYARIMRVMQQSEQQRPQLRRLGDQLGAWYTPTALGIAFLAWGISHSPIRFLSVLVIATPCPLLIAIPIAIIGSISLAARKGIIIKDPAVLESISRCKVAIFDKTGTLTYGRPRLNHITLREKSGMSQDDVLSLVASVERYSKHPLATAIVEAAGAKSLMRHEPTEVRELPGEGLQAQVAGHTVRITGRAQIARSLPELLPSLPEQRPGLECLVLIDGEYAAALQFRDEPRAEGAHFIQHLAPHHGIIRTVLISGDRMSEAADLAEKVGIQEVYADCTPEQKLEFVKKETAREFTLFLGDGINDAPALTAASIGVAFGSGSEITSEAAGAVILESSLERVDVLFHIGQRLRTIALQSAVGGMALSIAGMGLAATGHITPVQGALGQEIIDVLAVANALRAAIPPRTLSDC